MNRRKLLTFIGLAPLAPLAITAAKASEPSGLIEYNPLLEAYRMTRTDEPSKAAMAYWSDYGSMDFKWTKPEGCTTITIEAVGYRWPLDAHKA